MKDIENLSKVYGIMLAFNEMIKCGCKQLALGSPTSDSAERDAYMEYATLICKEAGTHCCLEDGGLITDLFPASMNKGKFNILFYKDEVYRDMYFSLKDRKDALVRSNCYGEAERRLIAYEFGRMLSYTNEAISRMIAENNDLE